MPPVTTQKALLERHYFSKKVRQETQATWATSISSIEILVPTSAAAMGTPCYG